MRLRFELAACALLPACALHTAFSNSQATQWSIVSGAVCVGQPAELEITPANPATLLDKSGKVEVPTVIVAGQTAALTATWSGTAVVAAIPASLPAGTYDIVITRASDHAAATIKGALQVSPAPVISSVTGQAACSASGSTQTFTIAGANLGAFTAVTLTGDASGPLPTTLNADGSLSAKVALAGKTLGAQYAINVSNGVGCTATYAGQGFEILPPPSVTSVIAGPHLHSLPQSLAQNAAVTVRVSGSELAAGTLVTFGDVATNAVAASPGVSDGSSIDATFGAGALAVGAGQAIGVANGACVASATPTLDVAAPDMTLSRLSPTAWNASDNGAFFDVFGDFSAAGAGPAFWIDTDASVFTETWLQVGAFVGLDAAGKALRFANPSGGAAVSVANFGVSNASLTSADGTSHEAFFPLFQVLQTAVPRIVWKDRDWVNAKGAVDSFTVYGCGFDAASFKLIDTSGADVANGDLSGTAVAADAWGTSKFKCTNGNGAGDWVTEMVTLTTNKDLAKGVYRVRAFVPATAPEIDADDLYPLVGYDDGSLTLGSFAETTVSVSTGRKNASGVIAADATGRRYLYVIGGGAVSTLDPSDGGSAGITTYEFSALDPQNLLKGFEFNEANGDTTWDITPSSLKATYGMAMVADGTQLYAAGGTVDGSTVSSALLVSPVNDPTQGKPAGVLNDFSGTHNICSSVCGSNEPIYGAKAVLLNVASGGTLYRALAVVGGFSGADTLENPTATRITWAAAIDASGIAGSAPRQAKANILQAPAALAFVSGYQQPGTLFSELGFFTADTNKEQSFGVSVTGPAFVFADAPTADAVSGLPNSTGCGGGSSPCDESGFGSFSIGSKLFMLGGTKRDGTSWANSSTVRKENYLVDLSSASSASAAGTLSIRRSLPTAIFAPPNIFVISGIVCKNGDTDLNCDTDSGTWGLSKTIDAATVN